MVIIACYLLSVPRNQSKTIPSTVIAFSMDGNTTQPRAQTSTLVSVYLTPSLSYWYNLEHISQLLTPDLHVDHHFPSTSSIVFFSDYYNSLLPATFNISHPKLFLHREIINHKSDYSFYLLKAIKILAMLYYKVQFDLDHTSSSPCDTILPFSHSVSAVVVSLLFFYHDSLLLPFNDYCR